LPGMYVRVLLQQGVDDDALVVPDQAIQRGADGLSTLMVIEEGKVKPVAVRTGPKVDKGTIITHGLNPGDMVMVEGLQKARPGTPVEPMPWSKGQDENSSESSQKK